MKAALIYYSKTGFTKQYAQWLAEEIDCDLIPWEEARKVDFSSYPVMIFASWIHAGKIQKLNWLKDQNWEEKEKIVLVTGAAPADLESVEETIENNFQNDRKEYQIFYLESGINYSKMGLGDKVMMKVFSSMLKKKKEKNCYEEEMTNLVDHSFDHSKKEYLQPVLEYLQTNPFL